MLLKDSEQPSGTYVELKYNVNADELGIKFNEFNGLVDMDSEGLSFFKEDGRLIACIPAMLGRGVLESAEIADETVNAYLEHHYDVDGLPHPYEVKCVETTALSEVLTGKFETL